MPGAGRRVGREVVQREMRAARPALAAEHTLEVHRALQLADHRVPGADDALGAVVNQRRGLDSQALAALGAASGDDGTAATRLHAHEEAVGAGAAGLGCLVGALHFGNLG